MLNTRDEQMGTDTRNSSHDTIQLTYTTLLSSNKKKDMTHKIINFGNAGREI